MTTFVDAFALGIGLDPSKFKKGMGEVQQTTRKTREGAIKDGAAIEKSLDGATQAVERLARTAATLFALFTGGRAIKNFVSDVTSADAAVGRLAKSIGTTPEVITSLGNAVARQGGSAAATAGSFERLADSINELKTTGNSSILPALARLQGLGGKQIKLNGEITETILGMADAAEGVAKKSGTPLAMYMLKQAGIDRDSAALFVQGRAKVLEAIEKSRKIGIVKKEDSEAAQKLQGSLESLRQTSESLGRGILTGLTPTITRLLTQFQEWIEKNKGVISTKIAEYVERFAKWIDEIKWGEVYAGLSGFASAALKVADAFGGIMKICGALFLFWTGSKALAIIRSILQVAGLMGTGPLGWAIRLAMAGAALGAITADQMPKVLDKEGAAGVDPSTGGATERAPMDSRGNEGWLRPYLRRGWDATKRMFGGGSADATDGGSSGAIRGGVAPAEGGIRTRASRAIGKLARGENVQTIIGELRAAGYNDNAIAAVVGSMQTESTFNPRAHNDITGGHTGLWQWDKNRWPNIVNWIKSRGGDPYDVTWQTKAWIAEHNAKPGDPIYDNRNTAQGGAVLRNNPSLEDAIVGVRMSERFGRGEEGGRAAHARRWLPELRQAASAAAAPTPRRPEVLSDPSDERRKAQTEPNVSELLRTVKEVKARSEDGTLAARAAAGSQYGPQTPYPNSRSLQQMNDWLWPKGGKQPIDWKKDPETGNWKPVFASGAGAALDAQRAGARAAMAQVQAAQAAMIQGTTNDNRSSADNSVRNEATFNGGINVYTNGRNGHAIANDLEEALKRRSFAAAANYGQA